MSIKILKDINNIPKLRKNLSKMKKKEVQAGVFGQGQQAMIAAVHEFGVNIRVTNKMRAYLRSIGIFLKDDTKYIRIPERSFIRSGWDKNEKKINKAIEKHMNDVLQHNVDSEVFLEALGTMIEGHLKDYLVKLKTPPLAEVTKRRKGSSNPLIDTGSLLDSITHKVK